MIVICAFIEIWSATDVVYERRELDAFSASLAAHCDDRPAHTCCPSCSRRECGIDPSLCERTSLRRSDARISARAALPFDGGAHWEMSRLHHRPHRAPRVWRPRCGCKHAMANGHCGKGQGSLGAPRLSLGWPPWPVSRPRAVHFTAATRWCKPLSVVG